VKRSDCQDLHHNPLGPAVVQERDTQRDGGREERSLFGTKPHSSWISSNAREKCSDGVREEMRSGWVGATPQSSWISSSAVERYIDRESKTVKRSIVMTVTTILLDQARSER
jgi:hypothetical protein